MSKYYSARFLTFLSVLWLVVAAINSFAANQLPVVYIVATGGTIAGTASSQTSSTYKAGSLTANQLIASVPELAQIANIKYVQLYNKDSGNVTVTDWLALNKEVNKLLSDPNVAAVVITHGTDTLSETSYFLDLTIKSKKPVVIVGSMRPATALSADGPLNLFNAVAVAANKQSVGRGVLVAMNDKIMSGRDVAKSNTTSVDTFKSVNTGNLGSVFMGNVNYYSRVERKNTTETPFNVVDKKSLPEVLIIYEYVGINTDMLMDMLKNKNLKGIVFAGMGDGNIPSYESDFLKQAAKQGIIMVRSTRVYGGACTDNYNDLDSTYGTIAADNLAPIKARILLMLSLTVTKDPAKIKEYFKTY